MKIKIRKNKLNEMKMGYVASDIMPSDTVLEDLKIFDNLKTSQQEVQEILMKNILFYDLETSGLSRKDDVIHQFAALQYTPKTLNSNPRDPDNLYLAKCTVPREIIYKKAKILKRRKIALEKTGFDKLKSQLLYTFTNDKGKEITAISSGWSKYGIFNDKTKYDSKKGINTSDYWFESIVLPTFFFVLIKNSVPSDANKNNWHTKLQIGKPDEVISNYYTSFMEHLKTQIDDVNTTGINLGELENKYSALESIYNSQDPTIYQVKYFYDILFKEDDLLAYVFANKSRDDVKKLNRRIKEFKNLIGMSHKENQELTHAKDFPLQEFRKQEFGIDVDNNEKVIEKDEQEGLQGFINFITSVSPVPGPQTEDILTTKPNVASFPTSGDTIIVGHNIVAFDNSFILERCKVHKIDPQGFSDLFVYDTRSLFEYFLRYVNFAKSALNFFTYVDEGKSMQQATGFKIAWKKSGMDKIYKGLLTKTGSLSAKLEKFMKMYNKDSKQTHTADDDCIQLAIVFNEIRPEIINCIKGTIELINFVDTNEEFRAYYLRKRKIRNYTPKGFSKAKLSDYKKKIKQKVEKVINKDDYFPEVVDDYLEDLYKKRTDINKDPEVQRKFVDDMRTLLNMSDQQVRIFYQQASRLFVDKAKQNEIPAEFDPNDSEEDYYVKNYYQPQIPNLFENKQHRRKIKVRIRK